LSDRPLPGARALIGRLDEAGVPYLFATNNSSVPGARYVERLRGLGIAAERAHVLTSNDAMPARLRREGVTRAFLVATEAVRAESADAGVRQDHAHPRAGLPYLATHPDLVCPTPTGPVPDCGAFIALFAAATGREPEVIGKPSAAMAAAIRERLVTQGAARGAAPPARVAFVGDRLYT